MFGTIRRHQAWLWIVIAALTIISFVIFGPTNSRIGSGLLGNSSQFGTINGKPITQEQFINASREVQLGYFISNGRWPSSDPNASRMGYNEDRQTYQRLFVIAKQEEFGIHPSSQAVAEMAREMLGKISLDQFIDQGLKPNNFDANDFQRFLQHELGIQQLLSVAGLSGKLVTPQEAKDLYIKEHQEISALLVNFSLSNYVAGVTVKPADVQEFYNRHASSYTLPERVQVNYVEFNLSNYLSQAQSRMTNIDQDVESVYKQYGTNAYREAKTPEEAKSKIKEEMIRETALMDARRAAGAFAEELDKLPQKNAAAFADLAKAKGLKVSVTAPFSRGEGPQGMDVPESFTQNAFGLTEQEPFAGPIVAPHSAAYVIAFKQRFPSEVPPFKSIEEKVSNDYRYYQAFLQAQASGLAFATNTVPNGLAQNKSFSAIAAEAKVKPIHLPPFSLSTRSLPSELEEKGIDFTTLKKVAFSTPVGKVSQFIPSHQGGYVVYVEKSLPLDQSRMDKELPEFLAMVRQARQGDAFNQWFVKQLDRDPAFRDRLTKTMQESQMGAGTRRAPRS
ncbi:SurA N-terminal domain-containing protein [Pedosphaera parvula]|uniref:PpiC domain-containing protein n=1 Tax=Pedosphaera parvula (strain Ellin514) TaxID=320771 RepID=B9XQ51_PEDPL|nr:SurA N-terminal domain-containing protein [Pedosphaera parvula]EEF58055.1 hypothetical protein Cflav_PD1192 [Pedosphaera parvula Ellin514]